MIVCIKGTDEDERDEATGAGSNTLAEVLVPMNICKHVVIVMDALKEFSRQPLQWALDHVIQTHCTITLLGVMPWLPLPLSCKTWLDVWTFDHGDLSALKSRSEWKNDHKYQKIRRIIEQCEQKGVVPCMKVAMGHPLKLVILEQTTNLHATLVVLDRHLRKNKAFFAERLRSSVVIMRSDGEVDMLKIQTNMDNSGYLSPTTPESTATIISTPQIIISEALSQRLK